MVQASPPPAWMQAVGLPVAWRGQSSWRVLDTDFGEGERFLQLWQAWSSDPDACPMLHLVALTDHPPTREELLRAAAAFPASAALARELEQQWFGLLPGFQRLVFASGGLRLTVCIGATVAMLRQQQFVADSIVIGAPLRAAPPRIGFEPCPWDVWALKSLTRLCRRGSTLAILPAAGIDIGLLTRAGWLTQSDASTDDTAYAIRGGVYQPRWQIKATRAVWAQPSAPVSHCVVVGAGLAGAAVAGALALRGRSVTVLEAAQAPCAGTSGLPVGLFTPQVSRDDGPRSRLSRAGIRMTLLAARRLLRPGDDWALSGVLHVRDFAAAEALPTDWPPAGQAWARVGRPTGSAKTVDTAAASDPDKALWHATAGWIKPERLVQAWLALPQVQIQAQCPVHAITLEAGQWQLWGPTGDLLAETTQLVIACAGNSLTLLGMALAAARQAMPTPLPSMEAMHGQVSWAMHDARDAALFPAHPVNGSGSVLAHVPHAGSTAWFAGATYEAASAPAWSVPAAHAHNLARMHRLVSGAAQAVEPDFACGAVHAWRGTRWTSADRLPIVGAWPMEATAPGLWISTAMGSRGLTHAALCGELIAAQMHGEPLPIDAGLHAAIDARRLWARAPRSHAAGAAAAQTI